MNPRPLHAWPACLVASALGGATIGAAVAQAPSRATSGSPTMLAPVTVTGTHLRSPAAPGLSPVGIYDRAYIDATGALTLADFLRYLPQNYTGISVGRGSVPNEFNPEFGQRTETSSPAFDFVRGAAAAPPGQTGVSGAGLRGLGSGSTLVLVDGRRISRSGEGNRATDSRQGFVDLNTIPLGAIERIEVVADGASAIYGADAVAGVINVILRKNYTGSELTSTFRGTAHGGARERQLGATTGFARGRLSGNAHVELYDRSDLKASQRAFAREQNHSAIQKGVDSRGAPLFGLDLRLNWGHPAVVQAVTGNLNGVFNAAGNPARVALAPAGTDGRALAPAQFTAGVPARPGAAIVASGQRRANTAEFIDLVPASERRSAGGGVTYVLSERAELYGRASVTDVRGLYATQPPVSAAAASTGFGLFATVVPAAYNPFGQDVIVGLMHPEFGSVTQSTHTHAHFAIAGMRGIMGDSWHWDADVAWSRDRLTRVTRDFDGSAVTAALRHPDPAQRLNPFADPRATGQTQAALYETLAAYSTANSRGELASFNLSADGHLATLPAGPLAAAFGAELAREENAVDSRPTGAPRTLTAGHERSRAFFAEMRAPLARRLELSLAALHESRPGSGATTNPKLGLSWAPHPTLSLRGGYSTGFRAPGLTELQQVATVSTSATEVTDPRRGGETTTVPVTFGGHPTLAPERSTHHFAGFVFSPRFASGLRLGVDVYAVKQRDVLRLLPTQSIVSHEAGFPGRVTRAAPATADIAANQPGRITSVDATLLNFGAVENRSIDYRADYRLPAVAWGHFRINVTASQNLRTTFDRGPGEVARDDRGDSLAPPKWKGVASVFWERGNWSASAFASHVGRFASDHGGNPLAAASPIPSWTTLDLRATHRFPDGVWRGYGRNLRLTIGVGNVLDRHPPFSDTLFGFNGGLHSPLGRTYELRVAAPF